jgi:hypothetical protein
MEENFTVVELMQRMNALERHNGHMKIMCSCSVLLLACLPLLYAAAPSANVEADRFLLKNSDGKKAAMLGFTDRGPALQIFDGKETLRISLELRQDEPTLEFFDENKNNQLKLFLVKEGPRIHLMNSSHDTSIKLETTNQKNVLSLGHKDVGLLVLGSDQSDSGITLSDLKKKRLLIQSNAQESAIRLADESGDPRITLFAQSAQAGVSLRKANNIQAEWKTMKDRTSLEFYDLGSKLRLFVGIHEKSPKLQIKDAEGVEQFLKP